MIRLNYRRLGSPDFALDALIVIHRASRDMRWALLRGDCRSFAAGPRRKRIARRVSPEGLSQAPLLTPWWQQGAARVSPSFDEIGSFHMIVLYGFGAGFGLPEISPFVTKTEVQLKMAGLSYRKEKAMPPSLAQGAVALYPRRRRGDRRFRPSSAPISRANTALTSTRP